MGVGEAGLDEVVVDEGARPVADPFVVVGVGPIGEGADEAVFDGVGVDVAADMDEILPVVDVNGLEAAFEQGAGVLVPSVVGFGVGVEDVLGTWPAGSLPSCRSRRW